MRWKMSTRLRARSTGAMLLASFILAGPFGPAAQVASAQCADPRGNSYCQNNGQVTFTTPSSQSQTPSQPCADPRGNAYCQSNPSAQNTVAPPPGGTANQGNSPAAQPNAPASSNASISLDPPVAPAGTTVTITGQGLGGGRSAWVNLSHMTSTGGLNLGAKQLATVVTGSDGKLSTSVTIPSVPSWTAGQADICIINATAQPICAPFTLGSADPPVDNTATTPDAIVGHYQCSSALLVGFGGGFCNGSEPILAINADGSYSWGDEQGGWTFDGATLAFDGGLGTGTVLNRKVTVQSDVALPGGGSQTVRYTYIRMDY
jgi:hypothetical protein